MPCLPVTLVLLGSRGAAAAGAFQLAGGFRTLHLYNTRGKNTHTHTGRASPRRRGGGAGGTHSRHTDRQHRHARRLFDRRWRRHAPSVATRGHLPLSRPPAAAARLMGELVFGALAGGGRKYATLALAAREVSSVFRSLRLRGGRTEDCGGGGDACLSRTRERLAPLPGSRRRRSSTASVCAAPPSRAASERRAGE